MATTLKQIDVAKEKGDFESLGQLLTKYKGMQGKYQGIQSNLFEGESAYTYPDAEVRENKMAKELAETRPDMALPKPKSKEEKLMDDTMAMLRENLPEPEKKEIQRIQLLPVGELRANLVKLEADRRALVKNNPELTKAVDEEAYLKARQEGKKLKPELTPEGKKLAALEDAILTTQQRIDEEEIGSKLPKGTVPRSLYELPRGYPTVQYERFADQTRFNAGNSLKELTQTLFNLSKGIEDGIANTPELINKKIEGLRAAIVRNALREVAARRYVEGMEMLNTDAALKMSSRIDENLRELITRIPALPKKDIIDAMGMAVEPRIELRGKPSQIKFKKQQEDLAEVRTELVKATTRVEEILNTPRGKELKQELAAARTADQVKAVEDKISRLPDMAFWAEKKRKLEVRQEYLENEIGGAVTGTGLQPTVVEKLGKITIDPRDPSDRPFANLQRALQIIEGDIDEAKTEAIAAKGAVQKATPNIIQERDPVAGLNALLPKTTAVSKLKSALYQAQNASKPNPSAIRAIKNQLIDLASDKRSAALYIEEIEKTKAKETKEAIAKEKAEEPPPAKPGGIEIVGNKQGELFPESLATIRATPQNFMRFLQSGELYKFREKLGLLEKKNTELSGRLSKAPTLVDLNAQRGIVADLNRLDEVVATYRFNAAQIWQNRKLISNALNNALNELANGTTPKIEELKKELKKYAFKQYTPEYKELSKKIVTLQTQLYNKNFKIVGEYGAALREADASVAERDATLEAMQRRVQDLMVRNVAEERKILARMERKAANQTTPAGRKNKEYADKARSIIAQTETAMEKAAEKRIATKRIEEQNSKKALEQLPVIRRITEQTRAFTKTDETKQLRADKRKLEKEQEKHAAGTPAYAKLSAQISALNADLDQAVQPLMRKVVQAEIIPEAETVKRATFKAPSEYDTNIAKAREAEAKGDKVKGAEYRALAAKASKEPKGAEVTLGKELTSRTTRKKITEAGTVQVARRLGKTTGYDYLTRNPEDINALIDKAQEESLSAEAKERITVAPTVVKDEEAGKVKVAEVKAKEGDLRDQLEATKAKLVAHNREVAATKKALDIAKTPKKIAELKKKLAGLNQSTTKQELGKKIDALTKEYREVRALGSGVERMLSMAEEESVKSARLTPLKTGVKRETVAKESTAKEATRREYSENEAAEAGVRRVDYLSVLDGLEGGFKARDEKTQGAGVSQADVKRELAKIKLPKGLDIIVLEKLTPQLSELIQLRGYNPKTIRGAVLASGKVMIVAGNHTDIKDVKATIAHELIGHVGVEGLLGDAGMRSLAKRIQKDENSVFELAKKLGVLDDVLGAYSAARRYMPEEDAVAQAVRELIAHVEEASPNRSFLEKANAFIKAMVGAVRARLRNMGLDLDISTSDIYKLLRDARANFKDMAPGAHVSKDGNIVFKGRPAVANAGFENALEYTKGIVAEQKSFIAKIRGEATGLITETKYFDSIAPVTKAFESIKDSLKATQVMHYIRKHGQRMAITSEVATNGPMSIVPKKRKDGQTEYMLESKEGANMVEMAEALREADVGNIEATVRVFTLWMAAQRAKLPNVGLAKLNFGGKITQKMLDEVEASVKASPATNDAFKKAASIYAEYNKGLINFAVQTGALSKKLGETLNKDANYVPFYRQSDKGEVLLDIGGAPPIKIGNLVDQPYLHELIGGDKPIFDIFTGAMQNTTMLTDMALRNMATKSVANTLGDLGLLKVGDKEKNKGIHPGDGPTGVNILRFKSDGESYWAEVNSEAAGVPSELLVRGMEGVNTSLPEAVKMLNAPARLLRQMVTRNPAYVLRQLIRDPMMATTTAGLDLGAALGAFKQMGKMTLGVDEGESILRRRGTLGGQVLTGTAEDKVGILKGILAGKKGWDYRMAQLDTLAIKADAATRVLMYNNFIKRGLSEMEADLATMEAMNFSKRGISPSLFMLSTMVPFMNAQMQGISVLYKAFTGKMPFNEKLKVKQKLMQRGLMMMGFTMLYASMMQDDEAYQNANDDEKYGNWFVPNPFGEEHIKVPIPFEIGLLFKAIPEAIVNTAFGDEKARDTVAAIGKMAWNSLPISGPQGVKPALEVAINHSFFTGREIESARLQRFEPGERYTERTSEIAKMVGGALNISPTKIEYLIRGYTGSLPLAVASLANPILRSSDTGEQPDTRGILSSETPLVGSFFQAKDASGLVNKAYKDMEEVNQSKETYKKMVEEGREQEAEAYMDANADMIAMGTMAGKFRKKMGDLTKQERQIRADSTMTGGEKREALDEIKQMKIDLAKMFSNARE